MDTGAPQTEPVLRFMKRKQKLSGLSSNLETLVWDIGRFFKMRNTEVRYYSSSDSLRITLENAEKRTVVNMSNIIAKTTTLR